TLRFIPDERFPSGQTYQATLQVAKIVKAAKGKNATFDFEFRTKDQNLAVEIDNLKASKNDDLSQQELLGTIYTADVAEPESIESSLNAKQNGKVLDIEWEHADGLTHTFIVKGISRGQNPSEVEISWNGKSIDVNDSGKEKVEVPALGDFKVREAQVLHDPEQYVLLQFSDPLQKRQNLSGLVELKSYQYNQRSGLNELKDYQGNLRFAINDNEIRVYPSQRLAGSYKLQLNPGIKNISGARMKSDGQWDLVFEEVKPQVRLVGKGVIMPNTDGLLFPFEAIGLNAVELEVFKIYNNNILQFLQSNQINGMYDLNTVGRIILQKKIDLQSLNPNSNNQRWMRYAMDLSTLFEQDPEAIYQVRIGFRPSYSTLACEDASTLELAKAPEYDEDNLRSIMDGWYGINGYYPGYDYNNRSNPCYPEYYNSEKFVRRNIVSSNLGIITKMGQNKDLIAIVSDLRTAAPISNSTVEIYDFQQQLIGSGKTDGNGFAKVEIKGKPFVCIAKQGNQTGYLRLQDGDALSVSRFNVSGARSQKGLKGYIYGERGVWRPGDSIYLNFVLDDRANQLPDDYPITMEVYDARGQLQVKRTLAYNIDQVYPMYIATETDAPTGNWSANVKVGGASFRKTIKVETVKPNRIEIDVNFGTKELSGRNDVEGAVAAKWLIGTPASGLKAIVEAQLRPTTTKFENYPSYVFDDPARSYRNTSTKVLFDGQLNEAGQADFSSQLLGAQSVPGKMRTNIRTRVFEKGGDFSTDAFSIDYSPFETYTGLEIPKNKYDEPRLEVGENGRIQFVTVDKAGKAIANRQLSVGFYRVSWRWWWDQGYDYVSNYNTTTHNNAQDRTELTTNSNGTVSWTIKPERWGRYLIRVCDLDGGHCSGSYVYAGYPWYGDDDNSREVAAMLNFKADKNQYTVGETVKLTIPSGKEGRALVTLENGSQVVDRFWVDAKEGENELTFQTTSDMAPTVYANVSMIQPHGQMDNDLPIRMYGVVPINVEDPQTILKPMLDMPNELRPEQTFTVEVNEASRQEMTYTLAVVDEGLLGLTRFKTPNPHDAFYAREALGVKTWDIYDNVLGAFGSELDRVLSIGGDDEAGSEDIDNTANRFEPVVRHLGPFKLEKGKKNKHEITLPNYVGAVRVMAVAASSNGAYG
ncbi:MAG: MG2 domain-containing protein, partial [Bacteroidota bacterium]